MPDQYTQGFPAYSDFQSQIVNDIFVFSSGWYVNRCPLVTRLPRAPIGSTEFNIINRVVRPNTTTLAAAVADTVGTTLTLADASLFLNGDVLELASGERVEITADPNVSANTVTIKRGVEGTTAATQTSGSTVTLIGNSRTGSEVDQNAIALRPTVVTQYCQTFQHPVQVGGSLQATTNFQTQAGVSTPFDQYKMDALNNLMDDLERSSYFGKGESGTVDGRPKQKGVKTLIAPSNVVTSPTNAGAYTATDLVRDLLSGPRANGGAPDVIFVSSNWMQAFAIWGQAILRLDAGTTNIGVAIDTFSAPFLGAVDIIEAPLLKPYTAFALTSQRARIRAKRNEFWSPRGNRGDAIEGDWIAEVAVELENPAMHAWLEGVTAFSAT